MSTVLRYAVLSVVAAIVLPLAIWFFTKSWAGSLKNISIGGLGTFAPVLQTDVLKEIGIGEKKEFVSIDGKLRVPYPAGWIEFPRDQLSSVSPTQETLTPLFLLQKIGAGSVAQFFGAELQIAVETFNEFLKISSKDAKERGLTMQVVSAQPDEFGGTFEASYSVGGTEILRSKERIIVEQERAYLFSFFTQATN